MAIKSPLISQDLNTDPDLEEESIQALIEETKSPEVRSRLASEGIILPKLICHLSINLPLQSRISHLRLLRNLCAGEIANQNAFLEMRGPERVASIILPMGFSVPEKVSVLGLQILGNLVAAGERQRSVIWQIFFPDGFLEMSRVKDAVACDALCMILCMCCCSPGMESRGRFDELSEAGSGFSVLNEILFTAHSGANFGFLIM